MSLYYPFGLLGLIGIPVLIVIYIIKSKYTEQTVSSTYLWELSERFLKKRKRVSKLTGIISLILQILVVAAASLLIAHPVFTIPNAADDYYFILDGSASMNMTDGGETRFERAQREITSIIDSSYNGSTYSLVFVGENTDVMFEGVIKKEQAEKNVNALSASWCEADCASALEFAQEYFNSNPSAKIYILSDKEISTENMQLIDVSAGENNFAICEYSKPEEVSGGLRATGKVVSYRTDETLTVEMWVAQSAVSELKKVGETSVTVTAGEAAEFVVEAAVESYGCVQLKIAEIDGMAEDNAVTLYDAALAQSRKVLLVDGAGDGSYIQRAINQVGNATLEYVQADFYDYSTAQAEGYGLYIFNGYVPETLPVNAAVWLVDAIDGTLSGAGPTFRQYEEPRDLTGPNSYYKTKYSEGTSAQERLLLQNIPVSVIKDGKGEENRTVVRQYAQYTVPRNFTTILSTADGDSLISVGVNGNGDREVVFSFRLGKSNFAGMAEFVLLVNNLMNYSFPEILEETSYVCGDSMVVNVVPGCQSIVVTNPLGKSTTLDTAGKDMCEVKLNVTGMYLVTVNKAGGTDELYAFAGVPASESGLEAGGSLALTGESSDGHKDGFYDDLLALFILISVFLLVDWGLYCYEQHQL